MIEGTDLYEYFSCPYKVYNRHNRDKSLMLPPSDFSRKLMDAGREHEKEVISKIEHERPKYARFDFKEGFNETVKLMKKGVPNIYQGVLMDKNYMGIPDLLVKQEGKSKFGNYIYIAADIKSSLRSKESQIMQIIFYDMLLSKIQGKSTGKGIVYLKEEVEAVDLTKYKDKFEQALVKIDLITDGLEYGLHIDTVCRDCPWKNVCIPSAIETHDVSLIYGLSRPNHYKLLELGIKTFEDLEGADVEKLAEIEGIGVESVKKWKEQAKVLITGKENITKIKLPEVEKHICLDIESKEDGTVYLIGLWDGKFKYFHSDDDEEKIVKSFVDYLLSLGSYNLYHYGSIERTIFKKLFDKYKIPADVSKSILSKMMDLLVLVRKNAILPISFYNLKDVAKYFGYKWRASDASGSNSMVWYQEWIDKQDKEMLKKIIDYNEDDVKATALVLKRLSNE
ncbi:TM0106 family RecB-like putative nuclease [Candidatus Woesearchaeota archaeon]|nr:TM0106 family RecB-like putative nuclease [Candidatus Woesearchaeota archaeon]